MKTDNLMIRVSPQLKDTIRKEAEKEGKTISEYITDLIKADLVRKGIQ